MKTNNRSSSHPRGIGNGYGIGGAKNSIFPTVNCNRKRDEIGAQGSSLQNTSGSMALDLRGFVLVPRASWRPEYEDQEAVGRDTGFEVLDFRTSGLF